MDLLGGGLGRGGCHRIFDGGVPRGPHPAVTDSKVLSTVVAIAAIAALTFLNTNGVVTGGLVSLVLTVLKVVPLLLIGTLGFVAFDAANLGPFNASTLPPWK